MDTNSPSTFVVRYIQSAKGRTRMIDNNNQVYFRHHSVKTAAGETKTYWKCTDTIGCRAMAVCIDGVISNTVRHTNHVKLYNTNMELAKAAEHEILQKSEDLSLLPKEIIKELDKLPPEVKCCMSCRSKILARMKRVRSNTRQRKQCQLHGHNQNLIWRPK